MKTSTERLDLAVPISMLFPINLGQFLEITQVNNFTRSAVSVCLRPARLDSSTGIELQSIQVRTFFFVLTSLLRINLSTSGDRSRAISAEQMLPSAHNARPTMNWFGWLRSLPQIKHYHYSKLGTPFEETTLAAVTLQGQCRAGLLFEGVGDEHKHLLPLVEEQHEAEVAHPLLRVPRGRDELEALHLGEMGGVAEHVDEHELGHVPVPERWLILADSRAYRRALTPHHRPLLRRRLARAYRAYHIPAAQLTRRGYSIGKHERHRSGAGWGEFWSGRGSHRRRVPEEKELIAMSEAKSSTIFSTVSMPRSRRGHAAARGGGEASSGI